MTTSARSPLVSVIIPAYNAAGYLEDTVDSVLRQTYPRVQAVIVDDGSTDETPAVAARLAAQDPRVQVVRQDNRGLPGARNTGIRHAAGEYLVFLDADDLLAPDKVERQLGYLLAHPETDLVYSDYLMVSETLFPLSYERTFKRLPLREAYRYTNVFPVMAALLRASLARRVGGFDASLHACEDWDFWLRCERAGRFAYLPGQVCSYRQHGTQMHRRYAFMWANITRMAQKNFGQGTRAYRTVLGSFCWWQFRLHRQGQTRWAWLRDPQTRGVLLRFLWVLRDPREMWFIVRSYRRGM